MKRIISISVIFCYILSTLVLPVRVYAQESLALPRPGTIVNVTPSYVPVLLKGLKVHPENPLLFDFILDTGQSGLEINSSDFKAESEKIIKYFLTSLTVKEENLWVNLSPFEKDRVVPDELGKTELGRDMLAQDYILKQLTASMLYPERQLGKKFWERVYAKAQKMFGTTDVPVDTFNKVWIVADKAKVLERNNVGIVVRAHMKVLLEEDYLALAKGIPSESPVVPHNSGALATGAPGINSKGAVNKLGSQIVREIIIPEIEKEVNEGKNFAPLRQIYYSMILASWYKLTIKDALLNQVYSNKEKTGGLLNDDPAVKEKIYQQYLEAFKVGVFNYVKEDIDATSRQVIPRKYFSGGTLIFPSGQSLERISLPGLGDSTKLIGKGAEATVQMNLPLGKEDVPDGNITQEAVPLNTYQDFYLSFGAIDHSDRHITQEAVDSFSMKFLTPDAQMLPPEQRRLNETWGKENPPYGVTEVYFVPVNETQQRMVGFQKKLKERFGDKVYLVDGDKLHFTLQGLEQQWADESHQSKKPLALHSGLETINVNQGAIKEVREKSRSIETPVVKMQVAQLNYNPVTGIYWELRPYLSDPAKDPIKERRKAWGLPEPRPPYITAAYFTQKFTEVEEAQLRMLLGEYSDVTHFGDIIVDKAEVIAYSNFAFNASPYDDGYVVLETIPFRKTVENDMGESQLHVTAKSGRRRTDRVTPVSKTSAMPQGESNDESEASARKSGSAAKLGKDDLTKILRSKGVFTSEWNKALIYEFKVDHFGRAYISLGQDKAGRQVQKFIGTGIRLAGEVNVVLWKEENGEVYFMISRKVNGVIKRESLLRAAANNSEIINELIKRGVIKEISKTLVHFDLNVSEEKNKALIKDVAGDSFPNVLDVFEQSQRYVNYERTYRLIEDDPFNRWEETESLVSKLSWYLRSPDLEELVKNGKQLIFSEEAGKDGTVSVRLGTDFGVSHRRIKTGLTGPGPVTITIYYDPLLKRRLLKSHVIVGGKPVDYYYKVIRQKENQLEANNLRLIEDLKGLHYAQQLLNELDNKPVIYEMDEKAFVPIRKLFIDNGIESNLANDVATRLVRSVNPLILKDKQLLGALSEILAENEKSTRAEVMKEAVKNGTVKISDSHDLDSGEDSSFGILMLPALGSISDPIELINNLAMSGQTAQAKTWLANVSFDVFHVGIIAAAVGLGIGIYKWSKSQFSNRNAVTLRFIGNFLELAALLEGYSLRKLSTTDSMRKIKWRISVINDQLRDIERRDIKKLTREFQKKITSTDIDQNIDKNDFRKEFVEEIWTIIQKLHTIRIFEERILITKPSVKQFKSMSSTIGDFLWTESQDAVIDSNLIKPAQDLLAKAETVFDPARDTINIEKIRREFDDLRTKLRESLSINLRPKFDVLIPDLDHTVTILLLPAYPYGHEKKFYQRVRMVSNYFPRATTLFLGLLGIHARQQLDSEDQEIYLNVVKAVVKEMTRKDATESEIKQTGRTLINGLVALTSEFKYEDFLRFLGSDPSFAGQLKEALRMAFKMNPDLVEKGRLHPVLTWNSGHGTEDWIKGFKNGKTLSQLAYLDEGFQPEERESYWGNLQIQVNWVKLVKFSGYQSAANPLKESAPGGIDLNSRNLELDVTKDGLGIEVKIDPAVIAEFQSGNFTGVVPVILRIAPLNNPLSVLGLEDPNTPDLTSL